MWKNFSCCCYCPRSIWAIFSTRCVCLQAEKWVKYIGRKTHNFLAVQMPHLNLQSWEKSAFRSFLKAHFPRYTKQTYVAFMFLGSSGQPGKSCTCCASYWKYQLKFFWATVSFSYALIWIQVFWVWLASVTRDKLSFFLRGKPEVYFQFATKFFGINNPAIFEHQCPKVVGIMALLWQCHSGLQWPISRSNTQGSIQVQIFKKHFFFI